MKAFNLPEAEQICNRSAPYTGIMRLLDIVVQLSLSCFAWIPSFSNPLLPGETGTVPFRIALVMWQAASLCVTAIVKEGDARYRFHAGAFWPLLLSLALGIALVPFNLGRSYFTLWLTLAQVLSIPYLLLSTLILIRTLLYTTIRRRRASFSTLFLLRQVDLYTQIAILAGAVLVTVSRQRPLQESLLIAYPLLAAVQTLSSLSSFYFWGDYAPWRSLIRIPCTLLQVLFIIGACVRSPESGAASWRSLMLQPAAQMLIISYLLITFLEWEALDRNSFRKPSNISF